MQVKPVLTLPISPGTAQTMADVEFSACPVWVKLRRTQNEQMSSGLALKADIALRSRHVSKVPQPEVNGTQRGLGSAFAFDCFRPTRGNNNRLVGVERIPAYYHPA